MFSWVGKAVIRKGGRLSFIASGPFFSPCGKYEPFGGSSAFESLRSRGIDGCWNFAMKVA